MKGPGCEEAQEALKEPEPRKSDVHNPTVCPNYSVQGSRVPEGPHLSELFSGSSPLLPPSQGKIEKERNVRLSLYPTEQSRKGAGHSTGECGHLCSWEIRETGVG